MNHHSTEQDTFGNITMTFSNMKTLISIFPLIWGVALGARWNTTYDPTHICALEGFSVNMSCSYTYPIGLKVTDVFWINQDTREPLDLSKNESYKHRVKVNCDKISRCSLYMMNLTKVDAQYPYYCRIKTEDNSQKWIGKPGISVSFTGLEAVSSVKGSEVKEDDHVTLTCKTTCNLTGSPSFIWSKDGRPVEKRQIIYNQLQLHPVSYEDEGSYTCAVRGHEDLPSLPIRIKVICPTVVSSNKEDLQEGDHVTLTCNTTCNLPSSPSFIWSKDGRPVEKKQIINNQLQLHPVSYEDEGNYTCAVRGHEDHNSASFRLQLMIKARESSWAVALVIMAGLVCLLCIFFCARTYKRKDFGTQNKEEGQGDVQHSPGTLQETPNSQGVRGAKGDGLSSTTDPQGSREIVDIEGAQGEDVQYASLQFREKSGALKSPPDQPEVVIYSSLQMSVKKSMNSVEGSGPHLE